MDFFNKGLMSQYVRDMAEETERHVNYFGFNEFIRQCNESDNPQPPIIDVMAWLLIDARGRIAELERQLQELQHEQS